MLSVPLWNLRWIMSVGHYVVGVNVSLLLTTLHYYNVIMIADFKFVPACFRPYRGRHRQDWCSWTCCSSAARVCQTGQTTTAGTNLPGFHCSSFAFLNLTFLSEDECYYMTCLVQLYWHIVMFRTLNSHSDSSEKNPKMSHFTLVLKRIFFSHFYSLPGAVL